ncbi:MAG: helix-turn-helix domain-containing protein [Oscillospiraceae bacterium]|nr:helix-turn-helix transcriptional regulator [Ruminococcus sp.]MDE6706774.1 helix-turn-helix domain-containing protein [Oscillospiraceae bacterium]
MDNAELGRRLKTARLAKKMTQSDVAGNFITRNMLSLIESGSATPSMKTLEYLSGVLEIPMEKLVSESGIINEQESAFHTLQTAKKLLAEKNYQQFLDSIQPNGIFADELHALCSIAHMELARKLAKSNQTEQLQIAVSHARFASIEASKGIYANTSRVTQANQLISKLAQYLSNYYSNLAQSNPKTS